MTIDEAMARCWVEVDLDALEKNYRQALKQAGGAMVVPVLKGDGYGAGAVVCAKKLKALGAKLVAVATVGEAVEIKREVDIDTLVLGMAYSKAIDEAILNDVIVTVYSAESAREYDSAAERLGLVCRAHVKINTGLNRLGFDARDEDELLNVAKLKSIRIEGIYTHLALHNDECDQEQFERFDKACELVQAPMKHILDSIGLFKYPKRVLDGVRTGAYLFGISPYSDPNDSSVSVISFYARVAQVRRIKKGEMIGYDDVHHLERDSVVATVSAGYVDGFPRKSDMSQVEIRKMRAKTLGLVCMDQMMVDVTDIPNVAMGDVVTMIGGTVRIREFAKWWTLNPNEAISRIGRRVPRVYKANGEVVAVRDYLQ